MIDSRVEIDWVGGNCPVQAEGRIGGKPFNFRGVGKHGQSESAARIRSPTLIGIIRNSMARDDMTWAICPLMWQER